jgi:hypothetical protein
MRMPQLLVESRLALAGATLAQIVKGNDQS